MSDTGALIYTFNANSFAGSCRGANRAEQLPSGAARVNRSTIPGGACRMPRVGRGLRSDTQPAACQQHPDECARGQ